MALLVSLGLAFYSSYDQLVAEYHFRAAEKALASRQLVEAKAHVEVCLQIWPRSAAAQFLAARIARQAGSYDKADQLLDKCKRLHGPVEQVELERSLLQVQQGGISRNTEVLLLRYVEHDHHPQSIEILEALVDGCARSYRIESALRYVGMLLDKKPRDTRALMTRGWVHERKFDWESARDDYAEVLVHDPYNNQALLRLAQALAQMGQFAEAVERFQELHKREPDNPMAKLGLAQCRYKLGQSDEAEKLLEELCAKYPRKLEVALERGRFALQMDQAAVAENWLRRAAELDPRDYQSHYSLYQCLKKLGKEKEAEECQKRLKEIQTDLERLNKLTDDLQFKPYEDGLHLRVEIAQIYFRSGQENEGVIYLKGALQIDPHYRPALEALTEFYEKKGLSALAREYRQRARQPSN